VSQDSVSQNGSESQDTVSNDNSFAEFDSKDSMKEERVLQEMQSLSREKNTQTSPDVASRRCSDTSVLRASTKTLGAKDPIKSKNSVCQEGGSHIPESCSNGVPSEKENVAKINLFKDSEFLDDLSFVDQSQETPSQDEDSPSCPSDSCESWKFTIVQDSESQDCKTQDSESQDCDSQDVDSQDWESQDAESQACESQDVESQDCESQGCTNSEDCNSGDSKLSDCKLQDCQSQSSSATKKQPCDKTTQACLPQEICSSLQPCDQVTQTCLFEEDSSSLEPREYVPEAVHVLPLEEAHQDTSSLSSLAMDNISLPDNMSGGHITGNMVMSPEGMHRGSKQGLTDDNRSLEGTALSGVYFFSRLII